MDALVRKDRSGHRVAPGRQPLACRNAKARNCHPMNPGPLPRLAPRIRGQGQADPESGCHRFAHPGMSGGRCRKFRLHSNAAKHHPARAARDAGLAPPVSRVGHADAPPPWSLGMCSNRLHSCRFARASVKGPQEGWKLSVDGPSTAQTVQSRACPRPQFCDQDVPPRAWENELNCDFLYPRLLWDFAGDWVRRDFAPRCSNTSSNRWEDGNFDQGCASLRKQGQTVAGSSAETQQFSTKAIVQFGRNERLRRCLNW